MHNKPIHLLVLVLLSVWMVVGSAQAQNANALLTGVVDVRAYGAKGNGITDDTGAIQKALNAAPAGGMVVFPFGLYRVTAELVIVKPVSLMGLGIGSQVYQATNGQSLFVFQGVQGVSVSGLYLGSVSSVAGTSLIRLENTFRSRFENVTMLGGYYGIHLRGALLNTFVDLRSGANIGHFFGATSVNQYWVFGERYNNISVNANTFLAPCLEGGTHGIHIEDTNAEGSLTAVGGTIEGVTGYAISLQGTGLPTSINGTHMELNAQGDISRNGASRVRMQSVLATTRIAIAGTSLTTSMTDSMVEQIVIGTNARRTILASVSVNLSRTQHPNIEDNAADTEYMAVTDINPVDWFGTISIGCRNSNSNPVDLTPNLKLDVDGTVRAQAYATGDIHFYKDGRHVQRLFEDEQGLYLEHTHAGAVSRVSWRFPAVENSDRGLTHLCHPSSQERNRLAVPARNCAPQATNTAPSCRLPPFCTAHAAASRAAPPLPGHRSALLLARQWPAPPRDQHRYAQGA